MINIEILLTPGGLEFSAVLSTPPPGVDIDAMWGAPIVVAGPPVIKMDQQLVVFDVRNGCHGNHRGIEPVLGLQSHPYLELVRVLVIRQLSLQARDTEQLNIFGLPRAPCL